MTDKHTDTNNDAEGAAGALYHYLTTAGVATSGEAFAEINDIVNDMISASVQITLDALKVQDARLTIPVTIFERPNAAKRDVLVTVDGETGEMARSMLKAVPNSSFTYEDSGTFEDLDIVLDCVGHDTVDRVSWATFVAKCARNGIVKDHLGGKLK